MLLQMFSKVSHQPSFWPSLMQEASQVDFGERIPELEPRFVSVWSRHYALISEMTKPKSPLLEIGTGYAVLATGLGKLTGKPILTTEHPSRQYVYQDEYQQFLHKYKVRLVLNDLREGLPFSSGSVKTVYACDVIEHLENDCVLYLLQEISRVLSRSGRMILSTPNLNRLSNAFRFILGYSVNPPFDVEQCGQTYGHIREFAPQELRRLLKRHGLRPCSWKYLTNPYFTREAFGEENAFSPFVVRTINALTSFFGLFFPALRDEMYIVATKRH